MIVDAGASLPTECNHPPSTPPIGSVPEGEASLSENTAVGRPLNEFWNWACVYNPLNSLADGNRQTAVFELTVEEALAAGSNAEAYEYPG